jgi:hypothetical protein
MILNTKCEEAWLGPFLDTNEVANSLRSVPGGNNEQQWF